MSGKLGGDPPRNDHQVKNHISVLLTFVLEFLGCVFRLEKLKIASSLFPWNSSGLVASDPKPDNYSHSTSALTYTPNQQVNFGWPLPPFQNEKYYICFQKELLV